MTTKKMTAKKITAKKMIDLLERIKLTHDILNELRPSPLPVLQKLDSEIEAAIAALSDQPE